MKFSENGKIFGKISIIDILVVIIAIILLYGVYQKFMDVTGKTSLNEVQKENTFEYVALIKFVSPTTNEMLKVDDVVYDKNSNTEIGKIKKIETSNAIKEFEAANGEILERTTNEKSDIKLTIESNGTINNNEHLASGLIRILVGENKPIKTKYVQAEAQIIDIIDNK